MRLVKSGVLGQLTNLTLVLVDFVLNKSDEDPRPSPAPEISEAGAAVDTALPDGVEANDGTLRVPTARLVTAITMASKLITVCSHDRKTGRAWCVSTPRKHKVETVSHEVTVVRQALQIAANRSTDDDPYTAGRTLPRITVLQVFNGWLRSAPGRAPAAARDPECVKVLLAVAKLCAEDELDAYEQEDTEWSPAFWACECVTACLISLVGSWETEATLEGDGIFPALFAVLKGGSPASIPLWRSIRVWLESCSEAGSPLDLILQA
jgi:hypothetical protein